MRNIAIASLLIAVAITFIAAQPAQKKGSPEQIECCPMDPKASAALDRIKALKGTWIMTQSEPGAPPMKIEYRPTANGTAVIETMFPGHPHEMINLYTADRDSILLTHYCAQGVQPRMRLSSGDTRVMTFEFVDGGNIASRNQPHMDSVTLTIDGDTLTQDWAYFADGKVVDHKVFTLKRQR